MLHNVSNSLSCTPGCRKTQSYYRKLLRQNYINHDDEHDPARLQEIMQQGREAGQWVVDKVCSGHWLGPAPTSLASVQVKLLCQRRLGS